MSARFLPGPGGPPRNRLLGKYRTGDAAHRMAAGRGCDRAERTAIESIAVHSVRSRGAHVDFAVWRQRNESCGSRRSNVTKTQPWMTRYLATMAVFAALAVACNATTEADPPMLVRAGTGGSRGAGAGSSGGSNSAGGFPAAADDVNANARSHGAYR